MNGKVSQVAEELADETYRLVASKLRALDTIDSRLRNLESRLGQYTGAFKTDIVEVERMITEVRENITKEQDESITMLVGEIQELKDEVNALKIEFNKLRGQRI